MESSEEFCAQDQDVEAASLNSPPNCVKHSVDSFALQPPKIGWVVLSKMYVLFSSL